MMCGFNYFDPHGHEAKGQLLHSIQIYGDKGNIRMLGYDWETNGVVLEDSWEKQVERADKKSIIFDMMIDLAEKEYNISIRKNSSPEQSTTIEKNIKKA